MNIIWLKLGFVMDDSYLTNIGSSVYLFRDDSNYKLFKLKIHEFPFKTDISNLP
jgi:cellulose 1,4-beta-cellobiosidase